MEKEYRVEELISSISEPLKVLGPQDRYVSYPAPIDTSNEYTFTFCSKKDEKALKTINASCAKVIICSAEINFSEKDYKNKTLILVKNPRLTFIEIIQKFFTTPKEHRISCEGRPNPCHACFRHKRSHASVSSFRRRSASIPQDNRLVPACRKGQPGL